VLAVEDHGADGRERRHGLRDRRPVYVVQRAFQANAGPPHRVVIAEKLEQHHSIGAFVARGNLLGFVVHGSYGSCVTTRGSSRCRRNR
jgi:hypothetical protein